MTDQTWPILGVVVLMLGASGLAALLRLAGLRRGSILAGAFVGLLLGSTVAGRVQTELHERVFIGGRNERLAVQEKRREAERELLVLVESGVSETAIDELKASHESELAPLLEAHRLAMDEHQRVLLYLGLIASGMIVGWLAPGARRTLVSPAAEGLFVASWTTVISIALLGMIAVYLLGGRPLDGAALGFAFAITGRPLDRDLSAIWSVPFGRSMLIPPGALSNEREREAINTRRSLDVIRGAGVAEAAGAMLWMIALFALLVALVRMEAPINPLVPGLYVVGVFLAKALAGARPEAKVGFNATMQFGPLTAVAALATLPLDALNPDLIWPALVGAIVGADARWFGVASGLRLVGVRWRPAMWFATPLTDSGAIQLAAGYLLWRCDWLAPPFIAAIVVGAITCDLTARLRPMLMRRMIDQAEHEVDEG